MFGHNRAVYAELLEGAIAAAEAGASRLAHFFRGEGLDARWKGKNDVVTLADNESEAAILEEIRRLYPEHSILAEEGGVSGGQADYQWLVDPLDGTSNFLQGLPVYAVSVACRKGDEIVAGVILDPEGSNRFAAFLGGGATWNDAPMRVSRRPGLAGGFVATGYPFRTKATLDLYLAAFREVFMQVRSIRRCGAAAVDLAYTAAGVYDGFFEFRLSAWDIAAGALLIREAGGVVTDLDGGGRYLDTGSVIAGSASVHAELLAAIGRHADEERLEAVDPLRVGEASQC
jgi:myo-inositol-1(or 4)-monophosphatase